MNEQNNKKFSNMWNDINLWKKEEIEDILNQKKAIFGALLILILISICLSVFYLCIFGYFLGKFLFILATLQITTTPMTTNQMN